jgi:hypothetical protein
MERQLLGRGEFGAMTSKEIAEALNNLKLERIGVHSMRGKIITG